MQQQRDKSTSIPEADTGSVAAPNRALPPAAERALKEAEERRRKTEAEARAHPPEREIGGRGGKDPARYGDWEIKGRAIDF